MLATIDRFRNLGIFETDTSAVEERIIWHFLNYTAEREERDTGPEFWYRHIWEDSWARTILLFAVIRSMVLLCSYIVATSAIAEHIQKSASNRNGTLAHTATDQGNTHVS